MDFATFISPLHSDEFEARYFNREPVVIRGDADSDRAKLLDWPRLNRMLQLRPQWTSDRIKLVLNSRPIDPDFYMDEREGRRVASPARVEAMLGIGATFVGDMVEEIDPDLAQLTAMLADRFGARAGTNVYASFRGVQAFASHCDLHEVFAVQCAGAKRWRVYRNRADNPIEALSGEDAQARIDAAKGPVLMDVTLQVGDMIYIPRGYFHDAVATDTASLHLTIGVAPPSGMLLFNFLQEIALSDAKFRHYLPNARASDGKELQCALEELGTRLGALVSSAAMRNRIGQWQRKFHRPVHHLSLPERPKPNRLARTNAYAELIEKTDGPMIALASGACRPVGLLSDAAAYILGRPAVVREEIQARFDYHPPQELNALLDQMIQDGLLVAN